MCFVDLAGLWQIARESVGVGNEKEGMADVLVRSLRRQIGEWVLSCLRG